MSTVELEIAPADPRTPEAANLIRLLTTELAERYDYVDNGAGTFKPEDALVPRSVFLIGRLQSQAVSCGAYRRLEDDIAEVKRMFVLPEFRGRGYARRMLATLENLARQDGYRMIRLETGVRQPESISLYERNGYRRIPRFGVYEHDQRSVCFEKALDD
jgi:GNAT superfamily N-acetyltransferase